MKHAFLAILATTIFSVPAFANSVQVEQRAEVIKVLTAEDGSQTQTFVPAERVQPGETVRFTVSWVNDMDTDAENVVLEMPIPEYMIYVIGSGEAEGVQTLLSVDGGSSFAKFGELRVSEGDLVRNAEAEDVTHLKWKFTSPLAAGGNGEVFYDAKLK